MRENEQVLAILDKIERGLTVLSDQLTELKSQAKFIEERLGRLQQYIHQTKVALIAEADTIQFQPKSP